MARLENTEIAAIFAEMGDLLQIRGGDRHRIAAFRRVARILESLPEPLDAMLRFGTLEKVPGVGEGTVHRVKQILRSGTCDDHRELRAELPAGLREVLKVKGVGPTTVRNAWQQLGVRDVDELEAAARTGALVSLPRMGHDTVQKILRGIEAYRERAGKFPLIAAERVGRRVVAALRERPEALKVELAGSVRRRKAAIGDLDVLVAADDPGPVAAAFVTLNDVEQVLVHGEGRSSVRLRNGQQCDLRVLPPASFGAGLHYFTGSKLHNVELRKRGLRMGVKISDKGIFTKDGATRIAPGETEEDIFAAVGLPWIAPELRENLGEIQAADAGRLPKLVVAEDLRGDLHMHTLDSDGRGSALQMAQRALELGYDYLAITDHSKNLGIARGLDEARLAAQMVSLRRLDEELEGIRVLTGIEVDILRDGELDLDVGLLAELDWVVASVHTHTEQSEKDMTRRLIAAMETGVVDAIGHPTGRRPGKRSAYPLDIDAVVEAARRHDVALECNGGPNRMDLSDDHCRKAREAGVPVVVATDAHAPGHLGRMEYGMAMARRAWLEPKHVLNCQPWETLATRRARRLRDHQSPTARARAFVALPRSVPAGEETGADGAHAWGEEEPQTQAADQAMVIDEAQVDALERRLRQDAIDPDLLSRVAAFLRGTEDASLGAALARLGENALQVAFELQAREQR